MRTQKADSSCARSSPITRSVRSSRCASLDRSRKRPRCSINRRDAGFVDACRALLANTIFLEQQDRGRLLGDRRMKWHDAAAWPGGKVPGDNDKWVCGKAFSFFTQPDGTRVGVCKMGWVTTSTDNGKTWSMPVVPPTLVTGKARPVDGLLIQRRAPQPTQSRNVISPSSPRLLIPTEPLSC